MAARVARPLFRRYCQQRVAPAAAEVGRVRKILSVATAASLVAPVRSRLAISDLAPELVERSMCLEPGQRQAREGRVAMEPQAAPVVSWSNINDDKGV